MKKERKEIYLDKNENPYEPSKNIIKELENFDIESFRLFPNYSAKELDLAMANNLIHLTIEKYYYKSLIEIYIKTFWNIQKLVLKLLK